MDLNYSHEPAYVSRTLSTNTDDLPAQTLTSTHTATQQNDTRTQSTELVNIKCLLINVGGLRTKLKALEFEEYIEPYDLVCLTETKLTEIDDIEVPGFVLHSKARIRRKRASGGVAIFVKSSQAPMIERIEIDTPCDCEMLWLNLNNITSIPLLLGLVYIPPVTSDYSNITLFEDVENVVTFSLAHW